MLHCELCTMRGHLSIYSKADDVGRAIQVREGLITVHRSRNRTGTKHATLLDLKNVVRFQKQHSYFFQDPGISSKTCLFAAHSRHNLRHADVKKINLFLPILLFLLTVLNIFQKFSKSCRFPPSSGSLTLVASYKARQ